MLNKIMTDKDVTIGAQWNKTPTTTTADVAIATEYKRQHQTVSGVMSNTSYEQVTATHSAAIYNGPIGDAAYAVSTRFQTPAIPHASMSATNVSGFVPPFPPSVGATSVLTPNPFMNTVAATGTVPNAVNPHFQHLNAQQQIEFTKIMNVMNTAVALSTVNTTAFNAVTPSNIPIPTTASIQPETAHNSNIQINNNDKNMLNVSGGSVNRNLAESVLQAVSVMPSASVQSVVPAIHGRLMGVGIAKEPNHDKLERIQQTVEASLWYV